MGQSDQMHFMLLFRTTVLQVFQNSEHCHVASSAESLCSDFPLNGVCCTSEASNGNHTWTLPNEKWYSSHCYHSCQWTEEQLM